jgi:hypothetical protein
VEGIGPLEDPNAVGESEDHEHENRSCQENGGFFEIAPEDIKGVVLEVEDSGKFLAIPLTNQAKAKGSPGEWTSKGDGKLQFMRSKQGVAFLFPGKGERHGASYILLKSVTQKADSRALPDRADLVASVEDEAVKFVNRTIRRGGAQ